MGSGLIQILIFIGLLMFFVLRLRDVLGTRDGFEPDENTGRDLPGSAKKGHDFDVIEGGKDVSSADEALMPDQASTQALRQIKQMEPDFDANQFMSGARSAYEMILIAFEEGDRETLRPMLSDEVYESFDGAITAREDQGLTIDAEFIGVRDIRIDEIRFDEETREADIALALVGELSSVVKDSDGKIVEGSKSEVKRQSDVWVFSRLIGSDNPNWLLVETGG